MKGEIVGEKMETKVTKVTKIKDGVWLAECQYEEYPKKTFYLALKGKEEEAKSFTRDKEFCSVECLDWAWYGANAISEIIKKLFHQIVILSDETMIRRVNAHFCCAWAHNGAVVDAKDKEQINTFSLEKVLIKELADDCSSLRQQLEKKSAELTEVRREQQTKEEMARVMAKSLAVESELALANLKLAVQKAVADLAATKGISKSRKFAQIRKDLEIAINPPREDNPCNGCTDDCADCPRNQ